MVVAIDSASSIFPVTSSSAKFKTTSAETAITTIARARTIQRTTAATLPRAVFAAPACFFLHAGRG